MRRSRYRGDGYRDETYRGGYGRRRGGDSCMRDACMLETGCCIAEALDGSCLMAGMMLLPQMLTMSGRSDRERGGSRLVAMIRLYQREISAHRAPVCRYSPSCSNYAIEAIDRHGPVRGTIMAARRLIRCRPGAARGADPVPALA
jgi:uncharacterized protein